MPSFTQYDVPVESEVTVDIDVEVDEFLDVCSSYEIDEVIDWLKENGHIKDTDLLGERQACAAEYEFTDALDKIYTKWNVLSNQETELIINIAKRF